MSSSAVEATLLINNGSTILSNHPRQYAHCFLFNSKLFGVDNLQLDLIKIFRTLKFRFRQNSHRVFVQ